MALVIEQPVASFDLTQIKQRRFTLGQALHVERRKSRICYGCNRKGTCRAVSSGYRQCNKSF